MATNLRRVKAGCYLSSLSMAINNMIPLLFITFRSLYGISFTLLGLLVAINFITQLIVDLILSAGARKINVDLIVKIMPIITTVGLLTIGLAPFIFGAGNVYIGLVLGVIIFAASSGMSEVMTSPLIAAIPSPNPERSMSALHSTFAWGTVGIVLFSALYLWLFGDKYWQYLVISSAILPIIAFILFSNQKMPVIFDVKTNNQAGSLLKNKAFILCLLCIFLGGVTENTMSQWGSGYIEAATGLDKIWGDVFGVAMFGVALGIGRTLYTKIGKNIHVVLFIGSIAAAICYIIAAITSSAIVVVVACAFTGLAVSMLWPGSLVAAQQRLPRGGMVMFALMATAGDLGGAVGPQFVGAVADGAMNSNFIIDLAAKWGMTAEQLGLKVAMLAASIFPLIAIVAFGLLWRSSIKANRNKPLNIAAGSDEDIDEVVVEGTVEETIETDTDALSLSEGIDCAAADKN